MKGVLKSSVLIAFVTIIFISCSKDPGDNNGGGGGGGSTLNCSTVPKTFSADVNPVFQASCALAGCHVAGSTNGPGPLTIYSQIFNARTAIRSAVASGLMPQGGGLSTSQKNSILCWIDNGAPNN